MASIEPGNDRSLGRVHLENRLTDILGIKADGADRAKLRPEVSEEARRESVLVS